MIPYHVVLIPAVYPVSGISAWLDSFKPLIVPHFFGGGAFFIFLLRQFFMTIPRDYDDAARIDGAGHVRHTLADHLADVQTGVGHGRDLHLYGRVE